MSFEKKRPGEDAVPSEPAITPEDRAKFPGALDAQIREIYRMRPIVETAKRHLAEAQELRSPESIATLREYLKTHDIRPAGIGIIEPDIERLDKQKGVLRAEATLKKIREFGGESEPDGLRQTMEFYSLTPEDIEETADTIAEARKQYGIYAAQQLVAQIEGCQISPSAANQLDGEMRHYNLAPEDLRMTADEIEKAKEKNRRHFLESQSEK